MEGNLKPKRGGGERGGSYYEAHKDEIRSYWKAYWESHREELKAHRKAHYKACKERRHKSLSTETQ